MNGYNPMGGDSGIERVMDVLVRKTYIDGSTLK